jgi:4-oxalocrotonate tautomerase
MPYVNVQITKGASKSQKAQVIKDITQSLVTVLKKRPEHIHVVIQEIADEDWGFEGLPTDEWKKHRGL